MTEGIILFVILGVLLATGLEIGYALGAAGFLGLMLFVPKSAFTMIGVTAWLASNSFTLIAIPLFILMGELMLRGKLAEELLDGIQLVLGRGRLPGGLIQSLLVFCAIFAALSGSSLATAATVGTVTLPEIRKRKYNVQLALGAMAAGGTLGILIPPSIPMVIYGSIADVSVAKLFLAGVVPGVIMTFCFMAYTALVSLRLPPPLMNEAAATSGRHFGVALYHLVPSFLLIGGVMGTIYFGIGTPTEAAAVGALLAFVLTAVRRELTWSGLRTSLISTAKTTAMMMVLVTGAQILAWALSYVGFANDLLSVISELQVPPLAMLAVVYIAYIFLGAFLDGISMMLLTFPVVIPMMKFMQFDLIWFGVVVVILIEVGLLTPPVGLNLYVIQGVSGESTKRVFMGSLPFVVILCAVGLVGLTAFPMLALWLPGVMK